jgi:hypothetical protein
LHFSSDSSPNARSSQAIEGSFTEFVSEETVDQTKGRLESSTKFFGEDNSISSKQSKVFLFINVMSQIQQKEHYCCNTLKLKKRNCYTSISLLAAALPPAPERRHHQI